MANKKSGTYFPFTTVESFRGWLEDSFGCINCKFLDTADIPLHEKRCTNEKALANGGDKGVEKDKSWIRQDDNNRKLHGETGLREDVNDYFMCDWFEDKVK